MWEVPRNESGSCAVVIARHAGRCWGKTHQPWASQWWKCERRAINTRSENGLFPTREFSLTRFRNPKLPVLECCSLAPQNFSLEAWGLNVGSGLNYEQPVLLLFHGRNCTTRNCMDSRWGTQPAWTALLHTAWMAGQDSAHKGTHPDWTSLLNGGSPAPPSPQPRVLC